MQLQKKPLFWIASFAIFIVLNWYFPNLFFSGRALYGFGLEKYREGDHEDYYDWSKIDRAAFYFEKAIGNGFTQRNVYEPLAHCYWVVNKKQDAERVYGLGIKQYPKDTGFYFYRATCRRVLQDFQGAFEDYDKVVKLDSNYEHGYYYRGAARYILGDTVNAKSDRLKAEKLTKEELREYNDYVRVF
jgi:tetratricopeptide (TPR) repeat protein